MAVYSYKTGTISPQLISFQTTEIGNFSSSALFDVVSQNNLFSLNSKTSFSQQRFSFSYNEFSDLYTLSEDYGMLFDGIASIGDYANSTIQEYANVEIENLLSPGSSIDDYGSISDTSTIFETYGTVVDDNTPANGRVGKIISATKYSIARGLEIQGTSFLFQGKSDYYINSSYIGYGILSHSNGISSEKNTESYVGTGKAFGFGSKAERVVVSYNNSSVVSYESLDYASITDGTATIGDYANTPINTYSDTLISDLLSPGSSIEDYGSILDDPNLPAERDDYGLITGRGLRPFGLTSFYSSLIEKNTENYVGTGKAFGFGNAKIFVLPIHYGKGVLKIRGAYSDLKNTESYVGTGRAFGFGSKAERTAVSYNLSSIVDYDGLDYGSITDGTATISDYANIPISTYSDTLIGDLLSPGSSIEDYGSITNIDLYGQQTDDYGLITGRGLRPFGLTSFHSSVVEKNAENYVGSGSLFNFGNVKVFVLPKHIGRGVLKVRGGYSDLKNTESYVGTGSLFAFSSTTEAVATKPPISGLFRISGKLIEKNTENYVGLGKLFNFGNVEESINPSFIGTGLLKIRGAYSDLKNTESYVGEGRAFGFGSKAERTAVSYNLSSTVDYEGLDYGSITDGTATISDYANTLINAYSETEIGQLLSPGSSVEDYGSILDDPNLPAERDDYGLITGRGLRPFGLTRFSSATIEKNTEDYVGSGTLFVFVSKTETNTYVPTSTGLFKFGGSVVENNTESYVGEGRAFGFGSKAERTAVSYNLSSVVDYNGLDYGLITDGTATIGDYSDTPISTYSDTLIGDLLSPGSSIEDYGFIIDNELYGQQTDDYGLITGRGLRPFGLTSFSGHIIEKNTESYVGTGSLFGFSSTTESFGPNPPENTVLFRISGAATNLKNTESYVGSGSLFTFISKTESFAYSPETKVLFKFSGHLVEKNTESYVGTGSLFGFSSTTESFGPKPPVSGLFKISGAATQSITPTTEIGSGSILTFISKTEVFGANPPENIQLFKFSGHLVEKNTESYVGTGSLFAFSSTTEAVATKPPASGLFRISGAATQSITPTTEIGSGSVFVSQASQILDAEDKTRLVAAYERVSFEEIGEPQAIRLSGKVGLYFQFREEGSGVLKVRGRAVIKLKPIHIGSGSYFIRGSAAESTTPATEVGSGSIFTFVSKTETFGANPPENTALFKFSSSSIVRNTESYVGIGLERINVESLIIIKLRYPGSGSVNVSGDKLERRNYSHIGSGNLFGFGSASEYLTNAYKLDTFVIKIRGSAQDSHSESYVGSGSVFAFIGGVESKGSNPPENIALFKFGGSSSSRIQPIEVGTGKLKFSEGSGRPDKNNKTFIVSSDESSSIRTIEEPTQIKIFGSSGTSIPTVYKGKGSLFGFGSKSESAAFSPTETKELFKISGSALEKNTESYLGSGSIFSFVGSSYSSTSRPKETTTLFNINGSASEAFAEATYNGFGSIITNLQSKSVVSFRPKSTTVLFEFVGSSKERNTEAYNGSGSIGVFISTAKSVFYDYTVSQKAFRIFGNTFESFAKSNYNGLSYAIITGLSENQKKNYVAPKRTRIFII